MVSDEDRIAAAQLYIDALANHRGDNVPFAADCVNPPLIEARTFRSL